MDPNQLHTFHIPVMGLSFTIDTPVKVARYGISSVISIAEDRLIELMRHHYYRKMKKPYKVISYKEEDYRALRISDYLNLVNDIVKSQIANLKAIAFEKGSDLCKFFDMLPATSTLKQTYCKMLERTDENERHALQQTFDSM